MILTSYDVACHRNSKIQNTKLYFFFRRALCLLYTVKVFLKIDLWGEKNNAIYDLADSIPIYGSISHHHSPLGYCIARFLPIHIPRGRSSVDNTHPTVFSLQEVRVLTVTLSYLSLYVMYPQCLSGSGCCPSWVSWLCWAI